MKRGKKLRMRGVPMAMKQKRRTVRGEDGGVYELHTSTGNSGNDYDAPERRRARDLVTSVMVALKKGEPYDSLPEDCAAIVRHWMGAAPADSGEDEKALRRELWLSHGHFNALYYGDDGEMQCGECYIDYKRQPVAEIIRIRGENGLRKLAAAPQEYPHLLICNGDRRFPAGVPGHNCCCLNIDIQMAARAERSATPEGRKGLCGYKTERWMNGIDHSFHCTRPEGHSGQHMSASAPLQKDAQLAGGKGG